LWNGQRKQRLFYFPSFLCAEKSKINIDSICGEQLKNEPKNEMKICGEQGKRSWDILRALNGM